MTESTAAQLLKTKQELSPARTPRSKFYSGMSALMLLIVLTGFARTLYLRMFIGLPELPIHLIVHGVVLTAWFLLAFTQTCLIATKRKKLHRKLGMWGIVLAVAVVAVSVWTLVHRDGARIDEAPRAATGNLASLFVFSLCILTGVWLRKRPAAHKRLMLFASFPLIAPAVDRIAQIPSLEGLFETLFGILPLPPNVAFAFIGFLLVILSVVAHDIWSTRRVHLATIWGALCAIVLGPALGVAVTFSGMWSAFVRLVW